MEAVRRPKVTGLDNDLFALTYFQNGFDVRVKAVVPEMGLFREGFSAINSNFVHNSSPTLNVIRCSRPHPIDAFPPRTPRTIVVAVVAAGDGTCNQPSLSIADVRDADPTKVSLWSVLLLNFEGIDFFLDQSEEALRTFMLRVI